MSNMLLAKLYDEMNEPDSSLKYAYDAVQTGNTISFRKGIYDASLLISEVYKKMNRPDSAYKYLSIANLEKDSLTGTKRFQELQRITLEEQERTRETNLINNALYAVDEKRKTAGKDYLPAIKVSTQKLDGKVEIKIADNGNGIAEKIKEKIFQPFFTTKPAGQGTGLGLSLSYDIIKAHGGDIKINASEGKGSEFSVILPLSEAAHK
jgi:signal transduction histidine kinase